jgi:hypothetical protein
MPDLTLPARRAFWIDDEYDRDHSSDGVSRFGAYVRDRMRQFAEAWDGTWDDGTVPFACTTWRTATSPVMAPGYVRMHPRVLSAQVIRNDWDGSLAADVHLITGQPEPLRYLPVDPASGSATWRDWPSEYSFSRDTDDYYEPTGEDVTRGAYLLASARLCATLPAGRLSRPGPSWALPGAAEREAQYAVTVLVDVLNQVIGPVLHRIEAGQ